MDAEHGSAGGAPPGAAGGQARRERSRTTSAFLRWGLALLLVVGVAWAVLHRDQLDTATLARWLGEAGVAAPLLFMATYAVATVLFLPGSAMTIVGGALFGPVLGSLYNLTGATIGATVAFLVARYLTRERVARTAGGRLGELVRGVEREGWLFVAIVRLVPLFPFNFLNYALGLTRIRLSHYVLATYLCMAPGAVAYTYIGYAGREAVSGGEGAVRRGLFALGLLAAVALVPRLIGRLRPDLGDRHHWKGHDAPTRVRP